MMNVLQYAVSWKDFRVRPAILARMGSCIRFMPTIRTLWFRRRSAFDCAQVCGARKGILSLLTWRCWDLRFHAQGAPPIYPSRAATMVFLIALRYAARGSPPTTRSARRGPRACGARKGSLLTSFHGPKGPFFHQEPCRRHECPFDSFAGTQSLRAGSAPPRGAVEFSLKRRRISLDKSEQNTI
jgi:hypothetical protein